MLFLIFFVVIEKVDVPLYVLYNRIKTISTPIFTLSVNYISKDRKGWYTFRARQIYEKSEDLFLEQNCFFFGLVLVYRSGFHEFLKLFYSRYSIQS